MPYRFVGTANVFEDCYFGPEPTEQTAIRDDEADACAKVAEQIEAKAKNHGEAVIAWTIANAIRARIAARATKAGT